MVTTLELPLPILVSPLVPKVVIAVGSVVVSAFSGILFNFLYRNRGSRYITKPYRKYYGGLINRLRYIGIE